MKSKKRLVLILTCVVLVLTMVILTGYNYILNYCNTMGRNSNYLSTCNYAAVLGVDQFEAESFIKVYGEPESIQRWFDSEYPDRELVLYSYPSFEILFLIYEYVNGETALSFLQIKIFDDSFRFGLFKIGVGSSRNIIRLAFLLDPKLKDSEIEYESHDYPEVDEGYYAEDWWRVLFHYDDTGKVESMVYTISPN